MAGGVASESSTEAVIMSGILSKQGGSYRSWKKRYFTLCDSTLSYYVKEGDEAPKGTIDLTKGRGVRTKVHCESVEQWPKDAKQSVTFGVAVEGRTYYLFGTDATVVREWKRLIQQRIEKIGNPTNDYKNDPEGKPEGIPSKIAKQGAKVAFKVSKLVIKNSGLDDNTAGALEGVADAAENQAEAGRDATVADRLKMAGGDAVGIVGDSVDNEYVSAAASVAKEQIKADNDTSVQQRLLMGTGTALGGVAEIVGGENEIAGAVVGVVGGVVHDQGEADDDMTVKQRLLLAGGSALGEGSGAVRDLTGVDIAADALKVAGGVVKDQAEADEDTSWKERATKGVGSTANGVAGLNSMRFNSEGKALCRAVEDVAGNMQESLAEDKE